MSPLARRRAAPALALVPVVLVVLGATVFDRTRPFVLAMPVFFAWTVFSVVATSLTMALVHALDPAVRADAPAPRDAGEGA